MKTNDLFKVDRSAKKLNESLAKTFGKKLNLEAFDMPQLEDARNKLRTQIHTVRSQSGFNETVENEALTQAQWMLDAINAELAEREEFVADAHTADVSYEDDVGEGFGTLESEAERLIKQFDQNANEIGAYGDPNIEKAIAYLKSGNVEAAVDEVWGAYTDQDGGEVYDLERYADDLEAEFSVLAQGGDADVPQEGIGEDSKFGAYDYEKLALALPSGISDEKEVLAKGYEQLKAVVGRKAADYKFNYDEDFPSDFVGAYFWLQKNPQESATDEGINYDVIRKLTDKELQDRYDFANLRIHRGIKGYDEIRKAIKQEQQKRSQQTNEVAPPGDKYERMVKHIKKGYAKDGKLTPKEKSIAYATAWKAKNKNESIEGEDMTTLKEGEVQQAQSIVSAKTMVDRVGRWIEDLSGMENDTLLTLGDQIRDEMSADLAKQFISQAAPALQQAIETLKQTRDTLAGSVRILTGEEQGAEMIGAEPEAGAEDEFAAEPDSMNAEPALDAEDEVAAPEDEFAAAEPAAGGLGDAGRAKRESIEFGNSLLKVLAG